jgi:hypothetical protein
MKRMLLFTYQLAPTVNTCCVPPATAVLDALVRLPDV